MTAGAAEHRDRLILADHDAGQGYVAVGLRLGVRDDRLQLPAEHAAAGVDLVHGDLHRVRRRAAEIAPKAGEVEDKAELDRVGLRAGEGDAAQDSGTGDGSHGSSAAQEIFARYRGSGAGSAGILLALARHDAISSSW